MTGEVPNRVMGVSPFQLCVMDELVFILSATASGSPIENVEPAGRGVRILW